MLSGVLLVVLGAWWGLIALFIGSGLLPLLALIGLYALAMAVVGVGLLLRYRSGLALYWLSIALPLLPILLSVAFRLTVPQSERIGEPDQGLLQWLILVLPAVSSLVALALIRRERGTCPT
jgi:hypothetical protein